MGVIPFALFLKWSDGRSCWRDVVLAEATAVLLMPLLALVTETGGRGHRCVAFLSSHSSSMAMSPPCPLSLP